MFVTMFDVFLDIFWPKNIPSRDECVLLTKSDLVSLGREFESNLLQRANPVLHRGMQPLTPNARKHLAHSP